MLYSLYLIQSIGLIVHGSHINTRNKHNHKQKHRMWISTRPSNQRKVSERADISIRKQAQFTCTVPCYLHLVHPEHRLNCTRIIYKRKDMFSTNAERNKQVYKKTSTTVSTYNKTLNKKTIMWI